MKQTNLPGTCPDCGGSLREVILFGRTAENAAVDAAVVHFADGKATRGAWTGNFTIEGAVQSLMCRACGRLFLYGVPNMDHSKDSGDGYPEDIS